MNQEAIKVMNERFGQDTILALGTSNGDYPAIRYVDAYYENSAFYVITYALSNKMQQIRKNPKVAICADWFTARGEAVNLGYFCKAENREIADTLRRVFATWIDNGHNNFDDENTIILKICLEDGVLYADGTRYDLDFRA